MAVSAQGLLPLASVVIMALTEAVIAKTVVTMVQTAAAAAASGRASAVRP